MAADAQIRALARRINALEDAKLRSKQPSLAYSSIEDGAIQSIEDDILRAIMGRQFDGTQAINLVNGPVPPVPSTPTGDSVLEGIKIRWDGTFAGDAIVPLDFSRVEAHVSTDPGFTAEFAVTLVATFETPRGGEVFVSLSPGVHYVKLVTRTQAGNRSAASAALAISPQPLSEAIPEASDGAVPPKVVGVSTRGGIGSIFLDWTSVTNPDPTKYRIYGGTNAGVPIDTSHLIGETSSPRLTVYRVWDDTASAVVNTVPSVTYHFKVVAVDADGAGVASDEVDGAPVQVTGPDIAANSIVGDHITGNSISADKFEAVLAMVSTLLVGENITIRPADSAPGANDNGIRLELDNGGHVYLPTDGSDVDLNRVKARFTEAVIEDELSILGVNNRVGGQLKMDASVPPPTTAPTLSNVFDQAPLTLSGGSFANCTGLGDNGTSWQTVERTAYNTSNGQATATVYNVNKSTGARSTAYSFNFYTHGFVAGPGTGYSPAQPTPSLVGFHSNSTRAVLVYYAPAWNYTFDDGIHAPVSGSYSARYGVVTINNSTGAVISNWVQGNLLPDSTYYRPSVFTDGTYTYVGTISKSDQKARVSRYNMDSTGGTNLMTSAAAFGAVSLNGMYVGSADIGSSRYLLMSTGSTVYSWNGTARDTANDFSCSEAARGLQWDGTRFYTFQSTGTIKKYGTVITQPSRVAKYTWYKSGIGTESTASSTATLTQGNRQWLKVVTPAIPTSSDSGAPNSVRIYVASQRQPDLAVGSTVVVYETVTTGTPDSPGTDGFAALGNAGSIISEKEESAGVPSISLRGDGKYRLGDQVDGAWIKYTPTLNGTGASLGNATHECRYKYIADKTLLVEGKIIAGSTTNFGSGNLGVSQPVAALISGAGTTMDYVGSAILLDSSASTAGYRTASSFIFDGTTIYFVTHETATGKFIGATVPWTWAVSDIFRWSIIYEVA